jgi:O-antigen ligase
MQGLSGYLSRDGFVRAIVTAGSPIALGYLMAVGIGFYLFLQNSIQSKYVRRIGLSLLIAGLLAPLSRGPWVGTAVLFIVFIVTGPNPVRRITSLALGGVIILPLISLLPGSERVINLLPFVGTTEKSTVDYRENLITNSIIVIKRNPWFGSINYMETPEMQALYSGGIIDVVNTYIGIALEQGFIGLGLFVSFFVLVVISIHRAMRSIVDKKSDAFLLGQALLGTLSAVLVIIFTVSSITIIPIVYWSVAGLGVAYSRMVQKQSMNNSLKEESQS